MAKFYGARNKDTLEVRHTLYLNQPGYDSMTLSSTTLSRFLSAIISRFTIYAPTKQDFDPLSLERLAYKIRAGLFQSDRTKNYHSSEDSVLWKALS